MSQHDLTWVDPDRREEVLRRIKAIEMFLKAPSRQRAEELGRSIGLGISQFYALVAAWKADPRPERVGRAAKRKSQHFGRLQTVTELHKILIRGAEAQAPPEFSINAVVQQIQFLAAEAGLALPSYPTLHRQAAEARRQRIAAGPTGTGLTVQHCAIDWPVSFEAASIIPVGTFVIDLERRAVIGLALDPVAAGTVSTARALENAFANIKPVTTTAAPDNALHIQFDIDGDPAWSTLTEIMKKNGLNWTGEQRAQLRGGLHVVRLFGKMLGRVRLFSRATMLPPERRQAGSAAATTIEEAERALRERICGPNYGLLSEYPTEKQQALLNELANFQDQLRPRP